MTEPAADVSAQLVFEAELHLTTSDYREGLLRLPIMWAFHGLAAVIVAAVIALTFLGTETTATEYLVPTGWLPPLALSLALGATPDLFAWRMARTSPFREGATVRLDAERIAYTGRETSMSYGWPMVRRAVETRSRFHLVVGQGLSTVICILPKHMYPLEDHPAIRNLIATKVGRIRAR